MGYVQNTLEGMCAIHLAAVVGSWPVVNAMLERDRGLGLAKDREGRTVAHVAAACGQVEVLEMLIRHDPTLADARTEVEWETILHMSARHNQLRTMKVILDLVGNRLLHETDRRGNTVMHTAAVRGNMVVGHACRDRKSYSTDFCVEDPNYIGFFQSSSSFLDLIN